MALDLHLQKEATLPRSMKNCFLSLEEDGYYWFLKPYFDDVSKQTNQTIDFCEDAFFINGDLDFLSQIIERIRNEIAEKPKNWEEFIGTVIHNGKRRTEKIYSTVDKNELKWILIKLEKAIKKAKNGNFGIFFLGD